MKDGLESLRTEIETSVDRAQDVTGKDEIVDTIRTGLEQLRVDVEAFVAAGPQGDAAFDSKKFIEYISSEFEHLHTEMQGSKALTRGEDADGKEDVEEAMITKGLKIQKNIQLPIFTYEAMAYIVMTECPDGTTQENVSNI